MPITTYAHPRRGSGDAKVKQHYTIPKLFISFVSSVSISISCPWANFVMNFKLSWAIFWNIALIYASW